MLVPVADAAVRTENFDREPASWVGVNHRNAFIDTRDVTQDFGWSAATSHAGGQEGEVGGTINPAGEPAYYAFRLPQPLTLDSAFRAEGRMNLLPGPGHLLLGFFNTNTVDGWRTPNTLVARINGRGQTYHCHLEYCTSRWRADAGVIGEIIRGERLSPVENPSGQPARWTFTYDPNGAGGRGQLTFSINGRTARCEFNADHRRDGITVTHFGLLPVMKAWDSPAQFWIDDVRINDDTTIDFSMDPRWEGLHNRHRYRTTNVRPKFDFGWSPTHHAGGKAAGELGGLIFRGDCRDPHRLAAYGDPIQTLTLENAFEARGKVSMLRGVSDSTAAIGFYHSVHSLQVNPSQKHATPLDFVGINIEGPSSEGFYFYPVYRTHGDAAKALGYSGSKAPRIHPDRKVHDWFLRYDPAGAGGRGQITVGLDEQTCTLDLEPGHKSIGARFDRFGLCTPWIDGNSVTAYFDDVSYSCAP